MRRRGRIALVSVAAALSLVALPASASASTASVSGGQLAYSGAAGETNNVTIVQSGTNFVITDPGAPTITANTGCTATADPHTVNCARSGVVVMRVFGGNMNDTETIDSSVSLAPLGSGQPPISLEGGDGNDTLTTASSTQAELTGDNGGSGNGDDTLNGGPGRDQLFGDDGSDVLHGGDGSDTLSAGPGNDTAFGEGGSDNFQTGAAPDGADSYNGGAGSDFIAYSSRSAPVSVSLDGVANDGEAGEQDNVMPDIESVDGGQAGDVLTGDAADNSLLGEDGNDTIGGGDGADQLNGGRGNDVVNGDGGNDELSGSTGTDKLNGGTGDDTFTTDADADQQDVLSGGPGTDLADYSRANAGVSVSLDGAANDGVPGENDNVLPDVEDIVGTDGADTLTGSTAANDLEGSGGADTIRGLGGADGLYGDNGSDSLDGGPGTDALDGGAQSDLIRSRDANADEVECSGGLDSVLANATDNLEVDCEQTSTGLAFETKRAKVAPSGKAKVKLACPAVEGIACEGTLVLRRAAGKKGKLARAKVSIPSGKTRAVKLKVKGLGAKRTAATAKATMTDASGAKVRSSERLVLVRKG
jgi:Ca2+-binding RTX toxin-like protein